METFKDVISGDQLVLVDFFATWCQPCMMMHPILEQVKEVLGDRIRIIKVDVDKYGVTANQYGIQSVPTLMLFCLDTEKYFGEQAALCKEQSCWQRLTRF